MARLRRIIGIAVLIVGVLLLALSFTVLNHTSETIPNSGATLVLVPQVVGGGTISFSWSGGSSDTGLKVYSCTDTTCSTLSSSTPIATGSGDSGSLSFSVSGYHGYAVQLSGSSSVSASVTVIGISIGALIGIILVVIGAILVVLRPKARPRTAEQTAADDAADDAAYAASGQGDIYEAEPEAVKSTAVEGKGSNPPAIKCAYCGTMNEPWITNCRWCKRTLTSTQK